VNRLSSFLAGELEVSSQSFWPVQNFLYQRRIPDLPEAEE
jgi:hypothetical protein